MTEGGDVTVFDDLPESIIIEEILVRLPAQDVLRCRFVRKSWYNSTSTNNFLLAHFCRQPSLPIVNLFKRTNKGYDCNFSVVNDSSATTTNRKLHCRTVLRCSDSRIDKERTQLHAACDGLFIVLSSENKGLFYVCNPTTHQRAPLPLFREHNIPTKMIQIAAFYQHVPSGEYRVLYSICTKKKYVHNLSVDFYVLVVGSDKSRPTGKLPTSPELLVGVTCSLNAPVLYRGSLHWELGQYFYDSAHNLLVFDTILETFRWLHRPSGSYTCMSLLEMNDMLAVCCSHGLVNINIYVMQDYAAEIWSLTHQINILELEGLPPLNYRKIIVLKIAALNESELLIQLVGGCVLHCDIDGKFLGNIEYDEGEVNLVDITPYRFRENIIPLPFFESKMIIGTT